MMDKVAKDMANPKTTDGLPRQPLLGHAANKIIVDDPHAPDELIIAPRGQLNAFAQLDLIKKGNKVAVVSGKDQALMLVGAQLRINRAPEVLKAVTPQKLNSMQRRAQRMAAGKLRVVDGKLVGAGA